MRQYEVDWKTFEECLPAKDARIVVEIERISATRRAPLKIYRHRSECVTGTFDCILSTRNKTKYRLAAFRKKSGEPRNVPITSRWYLQGSERLKQKGQAQL